jgi:hypothetical protein
MTAPEFRACVTAAESTVTVVIDAVRVSDVRLKPVQQPGELPSRIKRVDDPAGHHELLHQVVVKTEFNLFREILAPRGRIILWVVHREHGRVPAMAREQAVVLEKCGV